MPAVPAVKIAADLGYEQHILLPVADGSRILAGDVDVGFLSGV